MFLAAFPVGIGFRRNVLSRGALALLEWIGIACHDFFIRDELVLAFFCVSVFESDALLRSASLRSTGMPCFLSTSANASSASS